MNNATIERMIVAGMKNQLMIFAGRLEKVRLDTNRHSLQASSGTRLRMHMHFHDTFF